MSRTTDSVLELAQRALAAGQMVLTDYSHPCSPKKFTQPQLFATLAVRQQLNWSFRATVKRLREWSDLRQVLGLDEVPDQSTLYYAHGRLLDEKGRLRCSTRRSRRPNNAG